MTSRSWSACRASAETVLVNHGGGFRYFETHTPGLAPKGDTTWVFTAPAKKVPAGEPVVRVGRANEPPTVSDSLPVLPITGVSSKSDKKVTTVRATVANDGDFPQYDLVLYAWAKRDGEYVAAARKSIGDLGTGKERTVRDSADRRSRQGQGPRLRVTDHLRMRSQR